MEIKFTIPDKLIEKYRRDINVSWWIDRNFATFNKLIDKITKLLLRLNIKIIRLTKKQIKLPDMESIINILLAIEHETENLHKTVEDEILLAKYAEPPETEIAEYYTANIEPITKKLYKKARELYEHSYETMLEGDFPSTLKHIEEEKLKISKELYELKAILDSTLEILRHA